MALNDIVFVKGQGGLGRPLQGEDFISGLLFYGNVPSGFGMNNVKQVFSLAEAEALGIDKNYTDNDPAIAEIQVDEYTNSDTGYFEIRVYEVDNKEVGLGQYYFSAADTDGATTLTRYAQLINNQTSVHGYSASYSAGSLFITAPKKLGYWLEGQAPLILKTCETTFGVNTNFTGGTQSKHAIWHYHISEYFRLQPQGNLFIGVYSVPMEYTFSEIVEMQRIANGKMRQIGIWKDYYWSSGDNTAIQSQATYLDSVHMPISAIIASDLTDENINNLTDLNSEQNNKVSVVIGQDGAGEGWFLFNTYEHTISCLGATLGAVALSSVSADIAWIANFNMSNGVELDSVMLGNGQIWSSLSQGFLNNLDNKRYVFLIKYVGIAGSYFNDSHCAVSVASDYAFIENNRTIDKAIRGVYTSMLPNLNSPLLLNADGSLRDTTVAFFTSQASVNLDEMVRNNELSAYAVIINPVQPILQTGNLTIAIELVPIGVARKITINIGFTVSI